MKHSYVERAEKHLSDLESTNDIVEFRAIWQDFLTRLEMIWEKTEARYKSEKWFIRSRATYCRLRKKDPLLRYLKQARNAETHTIQGTLSSSIGVMLREKFGRSFSINSLSTNLKDGILEIDIKTPDILMEFEAQGGAQPPELVRFKNRGKWYNPPNSHLGRKIESKLPIVIAQLGLEFYKAMLADLEHLKE